MVDPEKLEGVETVFTVEEVAEIAKLRPNTIYNYIHDGKLKATKIGRARRITKTELNRFLKEGTRK